VKNAVAMRSCISASMGELNERGKRKEPAKSASSFREDM
jgi:hypothetical protein